MYIAIEGVIGVGKTTLARLLAPAFQAELLLEVFEENPFLKNSLLAKTPLSRLYRDEKGEEIFEVTESFSIKNRPAGLIRVGFSPKEIYPVLARLDFIVNNACQTVRRPPAFYEHMMAQERAALHSLPEGPRSLLGAYEGVRGYHLLPNGSASVLAPGSVSEVAGLTQAAELSIQAIALYVADQIKQRLANLFEVKSKRFVNR